MFIVDGEPLSQKQHPNEYKWMQEKFEEIRKSGKKEFYFRSFEKRAMYLRAEDNRLIPQKDRNRWVSMKGNTSAPTGVYQTWCYATSMSALKSDGAGRYTLIRGTMPLSFDTIFKVDKDIELIFFFLHLSGNRKVKNIDFEADLRKEAKENALFTKAHSLIYSEDSPIHPEFTGDAKQMKNIGLAWGIPNALNMDVYSVMKELWSKVQLGQQQYHSTRRGFAEFIEEVENYADTTRRSTVILGIESKLLVYKGGIWKLITTNGSEMFLCGVPPTDEKNREEYVTKYILDNEKVFEALDAALKNPFKEERKKTDEELLAPKLKRHELLSMAKDLGWTGSLYREVSKLGRDELQELVDEGRKPEIEAN